MGPVRSNLIESPYVATFTLNQDQQLKSNILVKSVRGMFAQIRMLSYVLIAKPGRMQNVSDLPIHNSNTTWTIRICNWCCLPFCNHFDLGFNAESNISNDFEISAIIQNQEGEYANILPTDGQRPHNNSTQFTAECSTEGGLEEHNSYNVHLESLRNHLKNDVLALSYQHKQYSK